MKDITLFVQRPEVIALIHEIRHGDVPLSELRRKLGRRKADNAISRCMEMMLKLKLGFREYMDDPLGGELKFVKECLGIHNGREKKHYALDEKVEVKEIGNNAMIVTLKGDLR